MLRIEAGLIFAGYEFDDQIDPFEAGIGFTVPLKTKDDDFVGREALVERARPTRSARWSASSSRATRPPATATASTSAGAQVGVVTSGDALADPARRTSRSARIDGPATPSSAPRSRSASSTATRSASRRRVVRFPFYDPGQDAATRREPSSAASSRPSRSRAFDRDGFLIVEEGLVSERALELLRERYERLFEGEYETGIKPDEVNWVPGRDPEDRTRQICNGWRADNVVAAQVLVRAHRAPRGAARPATGRAHPAGQRALEAARDEGDRLPPGLLVRRLPRARGDDHVLDLAPRDDRRRRADRVRPRLARVAEVAAGALAVPRARRLARAAARGGAELPDID